MRVLQANIRLGGVTLPKGQQPMVMLDLVVCGPALAAAVAADDAHTAVKLVAQWLLDNADRMQAEKIGEPETGVVVVNSKVL